MKIAYTIIMSVCVLCVTIAVPVSSEVVVWEDIRHFPWPIAGHVWAEKNEVQKTAYLELVYNAINYCLRNIGKPTKELDLSQSGPYVVNVYRVTPEVVSMYYRMYGDLQKSAEFKYKYWVDSNHKPILGNADQNPLDFVISGFEEAGMYKELAAFYPQAYEEKVKRLARFSNIKLFKEDFSAYKKRWPQEAKDYQEFMRKWEEAKKLAKTTKPKPLDPAVQHHEWFYSDKQEEVLKALAYYHEHKVNFMLEKSLKHKDPVIAAKAKEYLENLGKEAGGAEIKK